jgi:hypothetical protein
MSTKNIPGDKGRPTRKSGNLTDYLESVGASTPHSSIFLYGLLTATGFFLLYHPGHVTPYIGKLTEENSCVNLSEISTGVRRAETR